MTPTIWIGTMECPVEKFFGEARAIVAYEDAHVLADLVDGKWELSGEPASDEEAAVLKELIGPMDTTEVVVTPPSDE